MDDSHLKLKLVTNNKNPDKTGDKPMRAPKISPYCPACNGSTWISGNTGRADYGKNAQVRCRICAYCLANGKLITW